MERGSRTYIFSVYTVLILSFALTASLWYTVYSSLEPVIRLPEPEVTAPNGGSLVQPTIIQRYVSILVTFIRSEAMTWYFFFIFLVIVFLNEVSYMPLGFLHQYISGKRGRRSEGFPLVSIIVPAYNEEKVIEGTIQTLLEVDYPNKEIIVVNDGSTDATEQLVKPYAFEGKVGLINRPNGGKALALNTGILVANGEIIVAIDADGAIERDAIKRLATHFQDPNVVSVSGNVRVGNRVNVLTNLQALEYIREINLRRRAFDLLNTVYVVPGAIGAFRKSAIRQVGLYDRDTVTEDMDATIKLVKSRGFVVYEPNAVAHTEAPEDLRGWFRQRSRWFGGSLQTVIKHRRFWWRHGALSFIGFPYLLLSMVFIPIVELTALIVGLVYSLLGMWLGISLAFLAVISVELACSILSIFIDREDWRLVLYTPIYVLVYRYLTDIVRIRCFWEIYRGKLGWTRAKRYGGLAQKIGY
jgi:poly-beta-1,6 N-acetyl-D-glucosamine synthase